MKTITSWILFFACVVSRGETMLEYIRQMRGSYTHFPSQVSYRSLEATERERGGTSEELSRLLLRRLQRAGYDATLLSGHVLLNSEQATAWCSPLDGLLELGGEIQDNGYWKVPMTWVRCKGDHVPLLSGSLSGSQEDIDLFPGLVCGERLGTMNCPTLENAETSALALPADDVLIEAGELRVTDQTSVIQGEISQAVSQILNEYGGKRVLTVGESFPGYSSHRILNNTPVLVVDSSEMNEIQEAVLECSLWQGNSEVCRQKIDLRRAEKGWFGVKWKSADAPGCDVLPRGTDVFGKRVSPVWTGDGGQRTDIQNQVILGMSLTVKLTVRIGDQVVSHVEDACNAGDWVWYAFSCGTSVCPEPESDDSLEVKMAWVARLIRYQQDRYERITRQIFGQCCPSPIHLNRLALMPVGTRIGGALFQVEDYAVAARSFSGDASEITSGMAWNLGSVALGAVALQSSGGAVESFLDHASRSLATSEDLWCEEYGGALNLKLSGAQLMWNKQERSLAGSWEDSWGVIRPWDEVVAYGIKPQAFELADNFEDYEWIPPLVFLAEMQQKLTENHTLALELSSLAAFSPVYLRGFEKPTCRFFEVEAYYSEGAGQPMLGVDVEASRCDSRTLRIIDSSGKECIAYDCEGDRWHMDWDGRDANGRKCPDGDYTVELVLRNQNTVLKRLQAFTWDATPPQIILDVRNGENDGRRECGIVWNISDANTWTGSLTVYSSDGTVLLDEMPVTRRRGEHWIDFADGNPTNCLVGISAVDAIGNASTEYLAVALRDVVVGETLYAVAHDGTWTPVEQKTGQEPEIEVDFPQTSSVIRKHVLDILGDIRQEDGFAYQIRLIDASGRILPLMEVPLENGWGLVACPDSVLDGTDLEILMPVREETDGLAEGNLASLDMSALPNGKYTISVLAYCDNGMVQESRDIYLENEKKIGIVEYSETDGVVQVDGIGLPLSRWYSSLESCDQLGYGWQLALDSFNARTYDDRIELRSVSGETVSVRQGGSRDVTLTLPDGRRTTFEYVQEPGGGYSFTSRGYWQAHGNVNWTLKSTVSSDIVCLPGLEPYWNATGSGVPLEMFDFPGFILTASDGTEYVFFREHLGDYDAELEDGGAVMIPCYGEIHLEAIRKPNGTVIHLSETSVTAERRGKTNALLALERGTDGRIASARFQDGSGIVVRYAYSDNGNLIRVSRTCNGVEKITRHYSYQNEDYPHLLTRIDSGTGVTLASFGYDKAGRIVSTDDGQGGCTTTVHDVFHRMEVVTGANGGETVMMLDEMGRVTRCIRADGTEINKEYNDNGQLTRLENAQGGITEWRYGNDGKLVSRIASDGGVTEYLSENNRNTVTFPDGSTLIREVVPDTRKEAYIFPSGAAVSLEYDAEERLAELAASDRVRPLSMSYDGDSSGVVVTDGADTHMAIRYEQEGRHINQSISWIEPLTGETQSVVSEVTLDVNGKPIYLADDLGNYKEIVRDDEGNILREQTSDGQVLLMRRDSQGRVVQKSDGAGNVTRTVYNQDGTVYLETETQIFESAGEAEPGGTLVFSRGTCFEYDIMGRCILERIVADVSVALSAQDSEHCVCNVVSCGSDVSWTRMKYDACGRLAEVEDSFGGKCTLVRDEAGRILSTEDEEGNRQQFSYDEMGRLLSCVKASGETRTVAYDDRGNIILMTEADGRQTVTTYDEAGHISSITETGTDTVALVCDSTGRIIQSRQGDTHVDLTRNGDGQVIGIEGSCGFARTVDRDALGRCVREEYGSGRNRIWTYDGMSAQWREYTDGCGNRQVCTTAEGGGRIKTEYFDGESEGLYRVVEKTSDGSIYSTDADGCTTQDEVITDALGHIVERRIDGVTVCAYGYDEQGRLASFASQNTAFTQTYDAHSRIIWRGYTQTGGKRLTVPMEVCFEYDSDGGLVAVEVKDRWRKVYTRDRCGRVIGIDVTKGDKTVYHSVGTLDRAGRYTSMTETYWNGENTVERITEWTYDSCGKLVGENQREGGETAHSFRWSGEYDAWGNLTREERINDDKVERISYVYDVDGCLMRSSHQCGSEVWQCDYVWDGAGRLVEETTSGVRTEKKTYVWNPVGQLVECRDGVSGVSTCFHYDARGELCGETEGDGTRWQLLQEEVTSGGFPRIVEGTQTTAEGITQGFSWVDDGGLFCQASGDECVEYVYGLSGQCLGVSEGEDIDSPEYWDSWGMVRQGRTPTGVGLRGEWQDGNSGLVYLRKRFYMPRIRRFISPDGVLGKEEIPLSYNPFIYCLDDPVNREDATGQFSCLAMMVNVSRCFYMYHHVLRLAEKVYERQWFNIMQYNFGEIVRENDSATLIVHGVGYHDEGWSEEYQDNLKSAHLAGQDLREFTWSGFSLCYGDIFTVPNTSSHFIAKKSLECVYARMLQAGYGTLNLISHSWGTVLSRDALTELGSLPGTWVTMGSPLSVFSRPFHCTSWLNIYNTEDPVVHFAGVLQGLGYNPNNVPVYRQLGGVEQFGKTLPGNLLWCHGVYWSNYAMLRRVAWELTAGE